jgi:CubicO group peptidase (beta-lactamase class C family)
MQNPLPAIVAVALLIASAASAGEFNAAKIDRELARIVAGKGKTDPLAAASLAVVIDGKLAYAGAAGCAAFPARVEEPCLRPFLPETKFRVASISKMALAMGVKALAEEGRIDLDADISTYLGWRLRNPAFPEHKITTRRLLSHLSSVRDPEEYWLAAPGKFTSLFETGAPPFASGDGKAPGDWFEYANLNYGVLAGVIEGASGERFDRFMTARVFEPLGLDIGYNWSGVTPAARQAGGALPARDKGAWRVLVDGPEVLAGALPYFLAGDGLDRAAYLQSYKPGDNPTLFSPQGGLRASTVDLARLVATLKSDTLLTPPVWRFRSAPAPNGNDENGFFGAFGLGVQTVEGDDRLLKKRTLVGHSGEAYGVRSGAWRIASEERRNIAFAFVATGVDAAPAAGANPTFTAVEERLARLAFQIAEKAAAKPASDEPRPFDAEADATRDLDAGLAASKANGRKLIAVLGTNACHDSRGLAKKFATPPLDRIIADAFNVVWIDVGLKDRNLDVAKRLGVEKVVGTPTVVILSPAGEVLNADTAADWRTADSRTMEDAVAYFRSYADKP